MVPALARLVHARFVGEFSDGEGLLLLLLILALVLAVPFALVLGLLGLFEPIFLFGFALFGVPSVALNLGFGFTLAKVLFVDLFVGACGELTGFARDLLK